MREVRVGERTYRVTKPKLSRGLRAMQLLSRIFQASADIREQARAFAQDYGKRYPLRLTREFVEERHTRALREAQAAEGEEKAQWQAVADGWRDKLEGPLRERDVIEEPSEPPTEDMILFVFPLVYERFEAEVVQLLALMVIEQGDFRQARDEGALDAKLDEIGKQLADEGDLNEIAALLIATMDELEPEFQADKPMGKLAARFGFSFPTTARTSPTTPTSSSSTSSTDSPEPTDGAEETSSTGSGSERALASSAA